MTDKTFWRVLFAVVAVGVAVTVGLAVYTLCVYPNSSIIAFVSREWWP